MTLGDTRGDSHALVDSLAETVGDVEAVTLDETWGGAHALVDTLVDTAAEVDSVGDT